MSWQPPLAEAAQSNVRPPVVSIATYSMSGQKLPATGIHGAWDVMKAGVEARLSVSGVTVPGTVTEVHTLWTSKWRRVPPRHRQALIVKFFANHRSLLPGYGPSAGGFQVQVQRRDRPWQSAGLRVTWEQAYQPAYVVAFHITAACDPRHRPVLRWRVLTTAQWTDGSSDQLTETVRLQ